MPHDGHIDYGNLMQRAMRRLVLDVLADVARDGLPGDHHFFITFDTRHPGADVPDWLRARYPEDMTIVLQNWFADLAVDDDGFSVTLNFGDTPERLTIPIDAVRTFVDPSVEFGLRFESVEPEGEDDPQPAGTAIAEAEEVPEAPHAGDDEAPHEAEIVSLDKFRK